ncbi:T9SS type A sorting domain-containing protein [Salibacteraceae bacterium]|jgi:hypothetical protein|nr:T9SS type A sorting domain-containing protein [Salibacteraceae bacterium]MDB9709626.1 T9SS type A sorting domain-containing protein [Salibacteraceae bacterium]
MKRILSILALTALSFAGYSQCPINIQASTTTANAGDSINFWGGGNTSNNGVFTWTIPGGSPSSGFTYDTTTSIMSTFSNPGTYTVCVTWNDSLWNCVDSNCINVVISGTSVTTIDSIASSPTTCGSCNGTATVYPGGNGVAPYSYTWSSAMTSQTVTGLCAGNYSVTVTDANGDSEVATTTVNGVGGNVPVTIAASSLTPCANDSVSLTASLSGGGASYIWNTGAMGSTIYPTTSGQYIVTATDANGCTGSDTVEINFENAIVPSISTINETCVSCCDGEIGLSVTGGNGSFTYSWSNGSTSANQSSLCPGTYTVTITDAVSGCTQVTSATISAFTCAYISGFITQDAPAVVYLIEENGGVLSAVDSVVLDSIGAYYFQACPGTYYVKAALLPAHPMYASYIPTYYDSAALWSQANAIVVGNSNIYNLDFSLLAGTNTGGPGFVGGSVLSGGNRGEGDPVANAQVFITDMDDNVVAFTKTDAEGNFDMTNLAYGDYKMYVDILNKTSYPHIFMLNEEAQGFENANFLVFGEFIKPATPTGVESIELNNAKMFPNPAQNQLSIQSENQIQSVVIYSVLGEQMIQTRVASNVLNLDLSGLASGQYIVEIQNENGVQHQILVKE